MEPRAYEKPPVTPLGKAVWGSRQLPQEAQLHSERVNPQVSTLSPEDSPHGRSVRRILLWPREALAGSAGQLEGGWGPRFQTEPPLAP